MRLLVPSENFGGMYIMGGITDETISFNFGFYTRIR